MDVKPGYKQTEVGVIPEDWEVVPITNATSSIFLGLTSRVDYVERGGVPLVRATDIAGGRLCFDNTRNISLTQHKKLTQYRQAHRGDVLVSKSGSLGVCALVDTDLDFSIYESIIVLQPRSRLHSGFLLSLLRAEATQSRMIGGKVGSTVSHLNLGMFRDLAIPLPPTKAEQEAIAEALSDADALIESLEQLLVKKRQLKQGAMQELLTGKKRLPGFSGEWEVKRLGDVAVMGSGGTPPSAVPEYYDGDIPWVSISDMTKGGKVIVSTDRNLTHSGFANSAAQMLSKGTVLYAMYASLGECSIAGIELCSSQAILGIRPGDGLNNEFLYYFLTSLKPIVKSMGQQGTQANLNKGMVQDFRFRSPRLPEQTAIATILSDMDTEITALETKLAKARQIKQGMMQELLTGRIRLI